MTYGTGSTGYLAASRVKRVIDTFFASPTQTSASWQNLWDNRSTIYPDVTRDYIIGGGEANASTGWYRYLRRLHGSTRNTSTKSNRGHYGLPDDVWTAFSADHAILKAATTHTGGTTDADQGRRVYEFLVSDAINSSKYWDGQYRELLEAWAGAGSSELGSS